MHCHCHPCRGRCRRELIHLCPDGGMIPLEPTQCDCQEEIVGALFSPLDCCPDPIPMPPPDPCGCLDFRPQYATRHHIPPHIMRRDEFWFPVVYKEDVPIIPVDNSLKNNQRYEVTLLYRKDTKNPTHGSVIVDKVVYKMSHHKFYVLVAYQNTLRL